MVPSASFTDPEYGQVGLTERAATKDHEIEVGIATYDDLLRPVADGRPDGFCKLIADRRDHTILGGHVIGEYSAEIIQVVAACMAAGMGVEQVGEPPFRFPTFTEGGQHGRPEDLPAYGYRTLPGGVELPWTGRVTSSPA